MKTKHIIQRRTYLTTNGTRSLLRLAKLALMAIPTGLKMYSRRLQLSLKSLKELVALYYATAYLEEYIKSCIVADYFDTYFAMALS